MDEKLKKEIKAMVDSFFSEKEEAEVRKKTEEALQNSAETISELTAALEEKNSEVDELAAKVETLESEKAEQASELEAAQTDKASAEEKLAEAENTIEEMKKDKAAEERMAELEKAGVVSDNKETQMAKIREMSDEDFASYKEERVELRKAVIAELEANASEEEEEEETASEEEEVASEEETASEEEIETPPAEIDQDQSVSAALNLETQPDDGMVKKYAEMGKAMAALMTGKTE